MVDLERVRVVLVLDESGSMMPKRGLVLDGYNNYIRTLHAQGDFTYDIRVLLFHTGKRDYLDNPILTEEMYKPDLGTPLYDAMGEAINRAMHDDAVVRTLVVVMTDGEENESKEFTLPNIRDMVKDREQAGWQFIFLGENLDAWERAQSIGIAHTYNYNVNYDSAYTYMTSQTMAFARTGNTSEDYRNEEDKT